MMLLFFGIGIVNLHKKISHRKIFLAKELNLAGNLAISFFKLLCNMLGCILKIKT